MGMPNNPYAGGTSGIQPPADKPKSPSAKRKPVDLNHPVVLGHIMNNMNSGMDFPSAIGDVQSMYGINSDQIVPGLVPGSGGAF